MEEKYYYKEVYVDDYDMTIEEFMEALEANGISSSFSEEHSKIRIENATITTIPIYYLEPNIRVHLYDSETNLSGDYIISKYTIPLAYNGTMSITATKAAENIV